MLPQTYDYEYGTDRAALVARAQAAMDKELAAAWADRAPGLPLASPRDALILASIVERETAKPEERPHVAAVYLNRLRQGMKLQADPTVVVSRQQRRRRAGSPPDAGRTRTGRSVQHLSQHRLAAGADLLTRVGQCASGAASGHQRRSVLRRRRLGRSYFLTQLRSA